MMKNFNIGLDDNCKLQLHILVLGHYPMGESILIIVYERDKKRVHKSILIDCFEQSNNNPFIKILEYYGIDKSGLDFIIWTHPDKDHSIGFDNIIDKYTNRNTVYILPMGVDNQLESSQEAKDAFEKISSQSIGSNYCVEPIAVSNLTTYPVVYGNTKFIDSYSDPISFEIEILTPFSNHVFRKKECCNGFCMNDLSISVLIKFGSLNFYFGGDSEDSNIELIDEDKFKNLDFIKIPHHGSKSSRKLIEKVASQFMPPKYSTSVSTCFIHGRSVLPNIDVLNDYRSFSEGIYLTDNPDRTLNKGMWHFVYNISECQQYKPKAYGDAYALHERSM